MTNTQAPELKPCPFCGEVPHYREYQDEDLSTHNQVTWKSVSCRNDCASVEIPDGYYCGTAVERWNTRVDNSQALVAAAYEAAAKVVEPTEDEPDCDPSNHGDTANLAAWKEGAWNARAIRALTPTNAQDALSTLIAEAEKWGIQEGMNRAQLMTIAEVQRQERKACFDAINNASCGKRHMDGLELAINIIRNRGQDDE